MFLSVLITAQLLAAQPTVELKPAEITRTWRTPSELSIAVLGVAKANKTVSVTVIGKSRNGQPIYSIQVALRGGLQPDDRPAILIVAGIDGDHLLGSEVAVDIVQELLDRDDEVTTELLRNNTFYIIPQVNPDAANSYFAPIRNGQRRNLRPVDNDRDGLVDEDGGDDLNGDGYITMMRVRDLEKATHVADPEESRLNTKPDPFEGQSAEFVLYTEGIDNDEDGAFNEDGIGGVDLNENFMHGYNYHGDGSGPWQLSEPETRALIEFVLAHQEIAAIVVYGHHDTLSKPLKQTGNDAAGAPKTIDSADEKVYEKISETFVEITGLKEVEQPNWDGSFVAWAYAQFGVPSFSSPLWSRPEPEKTETEIETDEEDDAANEDNAEDGRQGQGRGMRGGRMDRQAMMDNFDADGDGELNEDERSEMRESMRERWGGRQGRRGRQDGTAQAEQDSTASSSDLTPSGIGDISQETIDELLQAAEAAGLPVSDEMMAEMTPEMVERYAKRSGVQIRRVSDSSDDASSSTGDIAWLAYSDDERDGLGFVSWTPYEHPQLGEVEIGGWVPYFKTLPPTSAIADITSKQVDFLVELTSRLPKMRLDPPIIKQLGNGLWEVKVAVVNDGWLPSGTAMAKKNKRARPFVVRIDVPNDSIVTGRKVDRIWSLEGGGTRKWYRWIIQGKTNSTLSITLFSEKFGTQQTTLPLKTTEGGGV